MNMDMFSFEASAWELFAGKLRFGDRLSAAKFLTLLEGEDEAAVEDAFAALEELSVTLDLGDLPRGTQSGDIGARLALEEKLASQADLTASLPEGDPLRLYLEELAAIPAFGDPAMLALELAEGKTSVQEQLVNLSLSRVVELAREFTGRGVLLMDLIQEGSLGLWQGILNYTGDRDFEEFRDWWIRQYMAKAVVLQAREGGVGTKLRQAMEAFRAADKRLLGELGRSPVLEEIALELNVSPEEAFVIREMIDSARTVQKAKEDQEPPEQTEDDERHVEDTAYFQMRQRIAELLSVLPEQEARVLTLRYGLEGGKPLDHAQTGVKLGLTAQEVMALEAAALAKLRAEQ